MTDETIETTPPTTPTPAPTPAMAEESILTAPEAPAPEAPEVPTYGAFKLPDGASVDGEQLEQATALFKEAGLPHEQAQKFIDLALSREQAAATRGVQAFVRLGQMASEDRA